jgi:GDP-mannose 6-dehydrogenase
MLDSILSSNHNQIERFVERVIANKAQKVGMIGLAFKANTDDMRESPYVAVAKRLIGEGIHLSIYDPTVRTERLIGSNKMAVQAALQHLEQLLVDSLDQLSDCEMILINHGIVDAAIVDTWLREGKAVIDLADIADVNRDGRQYEGIAW